MAPSFFDSIYALGTIPVLEIDNVDRAVPLAYSLLSGGLPVAEITLRTDAALDSIKEITRHVSSVLVGAGPVISREQAQEACEAGAKFLVCPGLADEVVLWAQKWHVPVVVGVVSPTEIIHALDLGLTLLKFLPAEAMGGLQTLTALSDPFPQVRFIPTGGIRQENLAGYLQAEKIHAVGGSWMAKRQAINEGRFDEITRMAKAARDVIKKIRG
jgi:2-dehydro-3-deoxyphosphogluconate aldolase/(4S)-4-hydroxy-2-oxoglutarate aldolase